jgi:hypothetical protein
MKLAARLLLSAFLAAGFAAADRPRPVHRFIIQGHVAGLGPSHRVVVVVTSPGKPPHRVTTQADGNYVLRNVLPGSYTVRPHHAQFRISPPFRTVAVTNQDRVHINFTAYPLARRR